MISRRSFVALAAAAPLARAAQAGKLPSIGLELYSVRDQMTTDRVKDTVTAVAQMGYEVVEFYGPYFQWTADFTREVRKLLDGLGIRCLSTHNDARNLTAELLPKAIERNQVLGSKYIVMASPGRVTGADGWKNVADALSTASASAKAAGLRVGYHNHAEEFQPFDGAMPIQIIAANTPKEVMLQLDVGTCVQAGQDPVKWIQQNPGRFHSAHLKEWGAGETRGYKVLFGEGDCPWKQVFAAAESAGGAEFYLIEQETVPEGSTSLAAARKCLENYRLLRA